MRRRCAGLTRCKYYPTVRRPSRLLMRNAGVQKGPSRPRPEGAREESLRQGQGGGEEMREGGV